MARQERQKDVMMLEWHYADKEYARNPQHISQRLHGGSQVVTIEETRQIMQLAEEAVRREDTMIALARCGCALIHRGKTDWRCIFFGFPVAAAAEVGYGRYPRQGLTEFGGAQWRELRNEIRREQKVPLSAREAEDLFQEWDSKGLVHIVVTRTSGHLIEGFCNCETPYCNRLRWRAAYGLDDLALKGHFVARINPTACNDCRVCVDRCQFGAIHSSLWSAHTSIDSTKCFGCGLCRAACKKQAITLVPRENIPVASNLW